METLTINGKALTTVSVEQLRTLGEAMEQERASAIGSMKKFAEAAHMQGQLLCQAELELGDAFDAFLGQLDEVGVDSAAARYAHRLAKRHKDVRELFDSPNAAKQLMLTNFAPAPEDKPEKTEGDKPMAAFTLSFHLNRDPLDWPAHVWDAFLAKAKPVVKLVQERMGATK